MFCIYGLLKGKKITMEPIKKTQIKVQVESQIISLLFYETPTNIPTEYFNYNIVFSMENIVEFLEQIKMNDYAIKLKKSK